MKRAAYIVLIIPWVLLLAAVLMATVFCDDRILGGYENCLGVALVCLAGSAVTGILSTVAGIHSFSKAKTKTRAWLLLVSGVLPLVVSGGILALVGITWLGDGDESHRTNKEYINWKKGKAAYNPDVAIRFLNVDVKFRRSLQGKTKEEVTKWFPDLRPASQANDYQKDYSKYLEGLDFLWIGDSIWVIVFKDGLLSEFRMMKGC